MRLTEKMGIRKKKLGAGRKETGFIMLHFCAAYYPFAFEIHEGNSKERGRMRE